MSFSKYIVALLESEDGIRELHRTGLRPEHVVGEDREVLAYVYSHAGKHGKLPARSTLAKRFGFEAPRRVSEPATFYAEELRERHLHSEMKRALISATDAMNAGNARAAFTELQATLVRLGRAEQPLSIIDYSVDALTMIAEETKRQQHESTRTGVLSGWPSLDARTNGLGPGDVLAIVGRPAAGKSWLLLRMALAAWRAGVTPMVVSMEMRNLYVLQRLAAMDAKANPTQLLRGELGDRKYDNVLRKLARNRTRARPFWLVDGALTATADDVVNQAQQLRPGIVLVDGAYLLRSSNSKLSRWDRSAESLEILKRDVAERMQLPVVISYQFNREQKSKKVDPGVENIAYTDAVGQLSSVVLGMMQAPTGIEAAKARRVSILKARTGELGEFRVRWEFNVYPMLTFEEMPEDGASDPEAGAEDGPPRGLRFVG